MRVLVTGAEGFVGGHLLDLLVSLGHEVWGTTLSEKLIGDHVPDAVQVVECDILDTDALNSLLPRIKPDRVFHLAALSSVTQCDKHPDEAMQVNAIATSSILRAAMSLPEKPKVLLVSSAEVYGQVSEDDCPLTEDNPIQPRSIYAASKACVELLADFFVRAHGLPVVIVRSFNHTGPRQSPQFVCSSFARQIAQIEAGMIEPVLRVGNLDARRDFLDVRDVVRAYWLALEKADSGRVYSVCSEKAVSIREILSTLLSFTETEIEVKVDPNRLRPLDIPLLVGNCRRLRQATGWSPTIPLRQTLRDLLNYWRASR